MEKLRRNRVNLALDKLRTLLPYATIIKKDMASLLEQTVEYINIIHKHCNRHNGDHLKRVRIHELEERKKEMKRSYIKEKSDAESFYSSVENDSENSPSPKMSRLDQQLLSPSLSKNKVESKLVIRKYAKNVVHTLQNGSEEKNNQPSYQPTVVSNSDSRALQNAVTVGNVYDKTDLQTFSINEPPKDREAYYANWNMYQQPQQQYYSPSQHFVQSGHQQPDSQANYQQDFEKYTYVPYDSQDYENKQIDQNKRVDEVDGTVLLMTPSPQSKPTYTSLPSVSTIFADSVNYGYSNKVPVSTLATNEATQSIWSTQVISNPQSSDEILPSVGLHFGAEEALNSSLRDENGRYVVELEIKEENTFQDEENSED